MDVLMGCETGGWAVCRACSWAGSGCWIVVWGFWVSMVEAGMFCGSLSGLSCVKEG
jgi:hypothetical protein